MNKTKPRMCQYDIFTDMPILVIADHMFSQSIEKVLICRYCRCRYKYRHILRQNTMQKMAWDYGCESTCDPVCISKLMTLASNGWHNPVLLQSEICCYEPLCSPHENCTCEGKYWVVTISSDNWCSNQCLEGMYRNALQNTSRKVEIKSVASLS